MMKIYAYIMTDDKGFAPNPFGGYCTLACCKPDIRRTADKEDIIIGIRGKILWLKGKKSNEDNDYFKVVYIMTVEGSKKFEEYYNIQEFNRKIPINSTKRICAVGDNIYKPQPENPKMAKDFEIVTVNGSPHDKNDMPHDLGEDLKNNRVLISKDFYFFGCKPREIPNNLHFLKNSLIKNGRGLPKHRCFYNEEAEKVNQFFKSLKKELGAKRLINRPHEWPENDESWEEGICRL